MMGAADRESHRSGGSDELGAGTTAPGHARAAEFAGSSETEKPSAVTAGETAPILPRRAPEPSAELADVIAYLAQRRDNAERVARHTPEFGDWARDRTRQLEIVIDDLRAGMHLGSAEVRARLLAAEQGERVL